MLSQDRTWFWKTPEQSIVNHGLRASARFFSRLKNRHQRTAPSVSILSHQCGSSYQPSYMHVMSAGMHHRYRLPALIGSHLARIRQICRLTNWERIHIGAKHDVRAVAVAEYTDYS